MQSATKLLSLQNDNALIGQEGSPISIMLHCVFSKKRKGTGRGMAIAKKMIEEHGGRIEVSGRPGTGTTITMMLIAGVGSAKGGKG